MEAARGCGWPIQTEGFIRTLAITIMLLTVTGAAHAAEINAFISTAIKAVTDELLPPFERANGHAIHASYGPSGALIPRFESASPSTSF
jgi:ABC-type molybdate transport system substrate-binding protein